MVRSLGRAGLTALLAAGGLLALAACNGGPASTPARDHSASTGDTRVTTAAYSKDRMAQGGGYGGSSYGGSNGGGYRSDPSDPRNQPIPLVEGKPMWAANRQHTAQENAEYHFERDGADFGAKTVDDYVAKAHAFVAKPPSDVVTLTRSNGDRLIYDAHGNVFAVVTRDGAPRTMFKPRDGQAYWDQQKEREASGSGRSYRADRGDNGDNPGQDNRRRYSRRASRTEDDQG